MVIELTNLSQLQAHLKENAQKLVVLDVYAQWCPPCKAIAPHIVTLSQQHKNVSFVKVDADEAGDVAQQFGVSSLPTFVFFLNQQEVFRVVGANRVLIDQAINVIQPSDPSMKDKLAKLHKEHGSASAGFNWTQVLFRNKVNIVKCKTPKSQRDLLEEAQNSDDDMDIVPKSVQMNIEPDLMSHVEKAIGIGKRIKEYVTAEDLYNKNKTLTSK